MPTSQLCGGSRLCLSISEITHGSTRHNSSRSQLLQELKRACHWYGRCDVDVNGARNIASQIAFGGADRRAQRTSLAYPCRWDRRSPRRANAFHLAGRRSSRLLDSDPQCLVTRKSCQIFPFAESRPFGLARPDAGRIVCPNETLGKGGREGGWLRPRDRTRGGIMSIRDKLISGPLA